MCVVSISGASVSRPLKCLTGRSAPGSKVREPFPHPSDSQSEESRKRAWRSRSEDGVRETRRFREEREESPSASSDAGSDSEGERGGARGDPAHGKRVKREEAGLGGRGGGEAGGRIQNGRAVIQHLKAAPSIKTEQDFGTSSASAGPGPRWGHPSLRGTPNSDSPPDSTLTPPGSEAPGKGLFSPGSPALSPPLAGSPLGRDERCVPGGRGPDFELLQRLAAGGAAGRVLFHPLALGPQGPQSLYAPSTIRYAPAELPPAHALSEGLPPDHPKPPPPPAFFPHLQRIAALPPFSGFSHSDTPFPPGLPFCVNGLRGAAGTEED